ncbi:MAG: GNAT family N-acetyltransferase [bacterium]|nr:GNAT family N-acetyltransferase [bacterium]
MPLVEPSARFEASYRALLSDFGDERAVPFVIGWPCDDFYEFLSRLAAHSAGIGLGEGLVPHSTFWLVDPEGEVVAVSNLRHRLTDNLRRVGGHIGYGVRPSRRREGHATEILRLTLLEAKRIGVEQALLTCSKGNHASARTIQKNGGVFEGEDFVAAEDAVVQRYWIAIP